MRNIPLLAAALLAGTTGAGIGTTTGAHAEPLRDMCAERPGLTEPACIVDKGHLQLEVGLGDWTLDRQSGDRTDTILAGDILARYGLTDTLEARIGWTSFGHVRERMAGAVERSARVGDVSVGLKQSLIHPDGAGLSVALLPFATLPVGRMPVGAGDWGAGLLAPLTWEFAPGIEFDLTPQIDAAVDEDGHGRHLALTAATGIQADLGKTVTVALDYQIMRDRDPADRHTEQLGNLAFAWMPDDDLQLDIGTNIGLTRASPDVELYFGVSRRF